MSTTLGHMGYSTQTTNGLLLILIALLWFAACDAVDSDIGADSAEESSAIDLDEPELPTALPTVSAEHLELTEAPPVHEPVSADFDTQSRADACWAGIMRECDRLFEGAEAESTASAYGATCGLRIDPQGRRCVDLFESSSTRVGQVLADGINLRAAPDIDAVVVAKLTDSTGGAIAIVAGPNDGWYQVVHQFVPAWIFGSFVSPLRSEQLVVRTTDREPIEVKGARGESLEARTGSFGLVLGSTPNGDFEVLLPTGEIGLVDPASVAVIAGAGS